MTEQINQIPMVPIRGLTVFPGMAVHFDVVRIKSMESVQQAMLAGQEVFLIRQKEEKAEEPAKEELCRTGVLAEIRQVVRVPQKGLRVIVYGEKRAVLREMREAEGYWEADISICPEKRPELPEGVSLEGMKKILMDALKLYVRKTKRVPEGVIRDILKLDDVYEMAGEAAAGIGLDSAALQKLLDEDDLLERFYLLVAKIEEDTRAADITAEIEKKVRERIDKGQREYILREQLKYIREELGEDGTLSDAEEFEKAEKKMQAPEEVHEKVTKEIRRFKNAVNNPTEAGVIRTYLETMLEMPWDKRADEYTDMEHAKAILEAEHYGLKEVKERVLEYLAVRELTKRSGSSILCLVGPPGTGKTSIAKSLAESMKKPYVRISLGGVRDEAEIRGHRKTYVGAMPGRIADGLRKAGVKNPVMLLDEIDKVSSDYNKGDTFSALLEVLDSEQNKKFRDHYLEVPLDLSEVVFVTTANTLQTIPRPLLDRMEIISVSSYTENEKMHIAKEHLMKKQLERHGLEGGLLSISDGALWKIIRNYTKEAGVRTLERTIGELCRKAAKEILESGKKRVRITERNLGQYLGKEKYHYHMANSQDEVGIVTGLAWTSVGGDTLQIEVNVLSGKGKLLLTGQMGDVMKESAQAGISYIRSISNRCGIEDDFFENHDIHVHIPEGAVPKDGPSAGITMATAILSAVTGKKVRADVAMTGEITLRGRVLPIGGLKEKLLAAKNAGVRCVLVPSENQADVEEISKEITKGLDIRFVSRMEEVLNTVLVEKIE
nr:endopeptidase La [uncultured Sellimonas sp.]